MTREEAIERLLALRDDRIRDARFYGNSRPFRAMVAAAMDDATALEYAITVLQELGK